MTKKALLFGLNYVGTPNQLNGCINDVLNIQQFLIEKCDYAPEDIQLLTDETSQKPTRANMQMGLQTLVESAVAGDTLLVHYSGHGARIRDQSRDETDGMDEVLVPLDYSSSGLITDDWLFQSVLTKVPAGVTLWWFMDCCHSGTILDLKYNFQSNCRMKRGRVKKNAPYIPLEWTDQFSFSLERSRDLNPGTQVCMFSGALDREYASDAVIQNMAQGAFTHALLQTLNNNLDATTGKLPVGKLKLRNLLKEINCRLDLNGFARQQCQLSLSANALFETTLTL
jgi:hypothetical protein